MRDPQKATFDDFAGWISVQATKDVQKKETFSQQPSSFPVVPGRTGNPGPSKDYRDSVRSQYRAATNVVPQRNQSPSGSNHSTSPHREPQRRSGTPGGQPRSIPRGHDDTTQTTITCAWCTYMKKPAQHATRSCEMFKNANSLDQWEAVQSHRTCRLCLKGSHMYNDCPEYKGAAQTCSECGFTHCHSCRKIFSSSDEMKNFIQHILTYRTISQH